MKIIGVIPARMGSSRFPGKPMAEIDGIPMIGHVWHRSKLCEHLDEVYVATCDQVIFDYIESIGGKAIMTADTHERCTDRTQEAVEKIESELKNKVDIVVMIQGDEPMLSPESIHAAISPVKNGECKVSNLMNFIETVEELRDPNEIKVIVDKQGYAMYMSREPVPTVSKGVEKPWYKQVCIIPFERDFLFEYSQMEPTFLEKAESIDMLRIMENGLKVKMIHSETKFQSVDNTDDLEKVVQLMKSDSIRSLY